MTIIGSVVAVSRKNVRDISNLLQTDGGFFFTVWRGLNWDFTVTLYDRPTIRLRAELAISTRHQADNATNPHEDREYRFGKNHEKKGLQNLFTSLDGDSYRLTIAPEWGGSAGINFVHGQYFYTAKREHIPDVLKHIFEQPIVPIDPPLTANDIAAIITCILEDLETKAVVRQIVGAGLMADAACGFD